MANDFRSHKRIFLRLISTLLTGLALVGVVGCAELAGDGETVSIPPVQIECRSNFCKDASHTQGRVFLVYTTSGCNSPAFGEAAGASATITCNPTSGCRGTVSSFSSSGGLPIREIPTGFYSICVTIDFDNDYLGEAVAGDAVGVRNNAAVGKTSGTLIVDSFSDK
ncbi:MAG: hypothetical protein RBT63_00370 [Bdellovibrionales bacterium]|jgi:hypothetical protein|nr:hypothetical protein [Bdellovibrionales bacterium]